MCRMPSSLLAKIACSSTKVGFVDSGKKTELKWAFLSLFNNSWSKNKGNYLQYCEEGEDVRYYKKASVVQNLDLSTRQMAIQ